MSWLRGKSRQFGAVLVGLLLVAGIGAFGVVGAGAADDSQRAGERSAKRVHVSRRARAVSQRRAQRKVLRRAHVRHKRHLAKRAALSTSWGYGLGADPKFTLVGGAVSSRTSALVNVANGNLVVSAKELTASPYDVQLPVVRWMNGLDPAVAAGSLGLGAQLSVGRDVRLETADLLGSQIFTGPSGAKALFPAQGLGFGSWHGGDLTLSRTLLGCERD